MFKCLQEYLTITQKSIMKLFLGSLFAKTSLTLTLGLFLFALFSFLFTWFFILDPFSNRAADDMAALVKLTSYKWLTLPPEKRPDYEKNIANELDLFISQAKQITKEKLTKHYPFVRRLEKALKKHTGQNIHIKQSSKDPSYLWIELNLNNEKIDIGFRHNRPGPKPPIALAGIFISASLAILLITLLLVRHITLPLRKIVNALNQFEKQQFYFKIPETGPTELAYLAKSINKMLNEISQLLENRTIFFGGISHDLRTPITRMQIALELLKPETRNNNLLIENLKKDLLEMESLIRQSLEFIKGLDKQSTTEIDLDKTLRETIADYKKRGQSVFLQTNQCGTYKIELLALKRVLSNLLDNAFQYSNNQPVILRCQKNQTHILIKIIDNGPGIPPDKIETVFQPFFRLEHSRNKKTGGSGLGLAIVYQLCQAHKWTIKLTPNNTQGLTATLKIPLLQSDIN